MFSFVKPSELREFGILGMNSRNLSYITKYNPRKFYPRVDDKLETKLLAHDEGIATPELLKVVREPFEISGIEKTLANYDNFVLKPSRGSAGKGILVIVKQENGIYFKPSGEKLTIKDIKSHLNNTLSGLYSLGGRRDKVLIEKCINFSDAFEGFSYRGVPDVRVILFKGFPMMAMMRLSTKASDGKANLHQGAVGVGIDLKTGVAINAVQFNQVVTEHPDTAKPLSELKVPQWKEVLLLACQCYEMSELGYLGVDIVLDAELGPQMLELNARPGLSIQIANGTGLYNRLKTIEALKRKELRISPEERIEFSLKHFC
jgi:alpha-L-glutamate ligase-like protein